MTCIVGLERKGTVWIGGDSAGTASDLTQRIRGDKKVFIKDKFIIGFCGSFRVGQLLRHNLQAPVQAPDQDDVGFLVNDFIAAVKACLSEGKEEMNTFEGSFLVGYKGKLYHVESDFQVGQPEIGFDACGSGADIAMGAMHASQKNRNPRKRITEALEASALNNAGVRPPFLVLSLKG